MGKNGTGEEKDDGEEVMQKVSVARARATCNVQERGCKRWAVLGREHSVEAWRGPVLECRYRADA